jgi:pyridoxine 4-dehydrogenase
VYPTRLTARSFEDACRASLARMGRDQLELVQAHWSAKNFQPWQEEPMWNGLANCVDAGLAQAVGTSNFGPRQLRLANQYWVDRGVPHTANQVQFSLLSTLPLESGLFEACAELGVTPIGYSPLALGLLSDRYDEDNLPQGPRGLLFRQIYPGLKPLLGTLREVAKERGKSVPQVAINWCMSKGAVVIVGVKSAAQAEENLGALGWELSGAECAELEAAAKKVPKKATQNIFQTD